MTLKEVTIKYFKAYEQNDLKMLQETLAESFTFSSPYDDKIDLKTYLSRCWPGSENIKGYTFERLIETDGEVYVKYVLEFSDGKRTRNLEHFRFSGDKVKEVDVYFGREL